MSDNKPTDEFVVVVVEDEFLNRMLICESLGDAGFVVLEAEHADAALEILQERHLDVHAIFTDVHMPGSIDGLKLAQLAKRQWPWIGILIASGLAYPAPEELPEGSRFLPKPYEQEHVVRNLRELVAS